jgi:hypothetical protein
VNGRGDETKLLSALEQVLHRIPDLRSLEVRREGRDADRRHDAVVEVRIGKGRPKRWLIELKSRALEPSSARVAALALREQIEAYRADYAVVVAAFVSERSAEILREAGVGYCDLSGNCYLASGSLLVERSGFPNAFARQAQQGSLLTAGAERVLRAVLDPAHVGRPWTVRELAEAAWPGVSVGQAHKVAKRLQGEDFLRRGEEGLVVNEPGKLLAAWVEGYRAGRNRVNHYYTATRPEELRERFVRLAAPGRAGHRRGAIASFSAAELIAPHVRQHRFFVYWQGDLMPVEESFGLKPVTTGENVVVLTPYDEGVLYPARHGEAPVTCAVQTYLDLRAAAGRGEEAAQAVYERWLREAYAW